MRYVSTRGQSPPMPFTKAVLTGLAQDGGLLVPERFPDVRDRLDDWRRLSYVELAQEIFRLYVDDVPGDDLDRLIAEAFATFDHPDVVPVVDLGDFKLLELFHGPTLSFKDVALQVLGRLFEYILGASGGHLNIMGATSGDTGSAAIHGVRGRANIRIFVLYPNGKTSRLQELQMTTVPDANVYCLAIDGSFDDCQTILKTIFGDLAFKSRYQLGAVNSMNWARVLAQMSYYVYAALKSAEPPTFVVPTGNFGNIFAGLAVSEMGVPINRFVLATNENDILARFFQTGVYRRGPVRYTLSPSMDIQIASNFERFLYVRFRRDAERVRAFMADFAATGEASLGDGVPDARITAVAIDDAVTARTIREVYKRDGYIVDPHTAVGIAAARQTTNGAVPFCMAAAHPAKFPESVDAAIGKPTARHPTLDALGTVPERRTVLPADKDAVADFVRAHATA